MRPRFCPTSFLPASSAIARLGYLPLLLAGAFAPHSVHATNGYFLDGYGAKAEGQAGVGIAWAQDALAAATNPAGSALVGDRVDLGVVWFAPRRSADIVGNAFGPDASYSGDGKKNFFLPEFGYTRQISSTLGAGIAVYGNGGLNTQYEVNPYGRFGATGTAGVNLEQLFVSPSIAWKPSADQSLGIALNVAYQRFSAQGIGFFGGFSGSPANVSDKGTDTTLGAGIRLGWTGTLAPGLTAGATWASRVRGSFSNYKGLFADGGRFDVPDNYGVGITYRPNAQWTAALDVQTIDYSHVSSVGDSVASLLQGVPLGAPSGPGFGWRNVTVGKLALSYQLDPGLVLRAGYSHAGQTVPSSQTFFNILAPGVVQDHITVGATQAVAAAGEFTGFFAVAPGKTVNGTGSIPPGFPPGGFGGGEANVRLKETIIGVSYAWKL
jgi:long-chain fatty acid transport protein